MIEIIYIDSDIIVCIKPAGINSTNIDGGLPELIKNQLHLNKEIKTVHRLDQVVGGLIVVALNKKSARILSKQIECGTFKKRYIAVVQGKFNKRRDILKDYLIRDPNERKTYVTNNPNNFSKYAELEYFQIKSNDKYSLLKIKLVTGRTHQIRCQLSSRNHPIVGDKKYNEQSEDCNIALWSAELEFIHPITSEKMCFSKMPFMEFPWNVF